MRTRLLGLMAVALIGTSMVVADAEAARVGGGRNVGRQSNTVQRDATPSRRRSRVRPPSSRRRPRPRPPARPRRRRLRRSPPATVGSVPLPGWLPVWVWLPCSATWGLAPSSPMRS
jgi:hypothetical protein